jgi:hypothetical protein
MIGSQVLSISRETSPHKQHKFLSKYARQVERKGDRDVTYHVDAAKGSGLQPQSGHQAAQSELWTAKAERERERAREESKM